MSAREKTCEESIYDDKRHQWEFDSPVYPCGGVILFDFKCVFCKKRKRICAQPDEPFDQAMYWEADE
jgi:hypothetical protein